MNTPDPERDGDEGDDDEPLTLRDFIAAAAGFVLVLCSLAALHTAVDFNWGWIPWKQLAIVGLLLAAGARWAARGVRALVRRMRGLPPIEREPTKRDRLSEKLRDLDEPYMRRERSLTRD